MDLYIDERGYMRFSEEARKGEKKLTGKELESALDADVAFRRDLARLTDEADANGTRVDDTPRIVNSVPLYGPAKLGEIAPMLARSGRWQSAAELKAIEDSRAARASSLDDRGDGRDEPRDTGSER